MGQDAIAEFAASVTVADLEADPYPIYARLRREAPVCYIPAVRLWFVTCYDDVEFVGTHPELFSAEMDDSPVDHTFGSPTILTVDGGPHLELRRSLDSKPSGSRRPRQDASAANTTRWPRRRSTSPIPMQLLVDPYALSGMNRMVSGRSFAGAPATAAPGRRPGRPPALGGGWLARDCGAG